jgi:hypothetical protein
MKPNERKIKFSKKIEEGDGYKHYETGVKKVTTKFIRRYKNCLYLLCELSPCERALMDYLTEMMSQNNIVNNTLGVRQGFINDVTRFTDGRTVFKESTVRHAFMILSQKGLLLQNGRACFIVNPEFFWNNNDEFSRCNYIQMVLEFQNGARTNLDVKRGKNGKIYSDVKVE